jgi:hypothetical protein
MLHAEPRQETTMPAAKRQPRRSYGAVRKLPSGRFQASYVGPDSRRHPAPDTFDTKGDADAWLAAQRTDISRGEWQRPRPAHKVPTFAAYADTWLPTRDLRPRTRAEYTKLLAGHILPTFADTYLDDISPAAVRAIAAALSDFHDADVVQLRPAAGANR